MRWGNPGVVGLTSHLDSAFLFCLHDDNAAGDYFGCSVNAPSSSKKAGIMITSTKNSALWEHNDAYAAERPRKCLTLLYRSRLKHVPQSRTETHSSYIYTFLLLVLRYSTLHRQPTGKP